jgi:serine/threonine protein kinase/ribosomal protein S27E
MSRIACPEVCDWQALLEGDRSEDQIDNLAHHLETCSDCRHTLESLAVAPAVWEDTARDLDGPQRKAEQEPALRHVLEQLKGEELPIGAEDLSFLQPTDDPDLLGLLGPYQVQEVIGRGGMGVVLKAFDPTLHRLVAIKVLDPSLASNATARRRFTRETQAAAAVCHEHVVAVHGVSESGGLPYLVMQYIAGESLQERLDRTGPLEVTEIVRIGLQTAAGLAAAHAQGLIHRDIKPANLLLENGLARIKITDFGLARMADDVGLTQNGVVAGTPEYMAPEQARAEVVDHRADLFSLGSVLYACCTGAPPFRGSTALAVLSQVSEKEPSPIRSLNPEVPVWLDAFIARLMAKDPAQRFQSAAEVAALLEGYLAHLCQPATVPAPNLPALPAAADITPSVLPERTGFVQRLPQSLWVAALAFLTALGVEWIARQFAGGGGQSERQVKEWYYDFRGHGVPAELTTFGFGDEEARFVRTEPEGLRVSLPQTWVHPWGGTGFQTSSEFNGDFEITTTFEVLQADIPPSGFGVGARLRIQKADPSPEGATFCRLVRNGDRQIVLWDRGHEQPGGKIWTEEGEVPCTDKVVRLRLKRAGNILHYLWASGMEGDDFQEIFMCKFGAEDIKYVQIGVVTGRKPCAVDVRFLDLRIRGAVGVGGGGANKPAARVSLWLVAGLFLILLLVFSAILGVRLYVRQRHSFGKAPVGDLVPEVPAHPETNSTFASFACSGCGKHLQAKAALAGKKVKCPQCGKVTAIPAADAYKAGQPEPRL